MKVDIVIDFYKKHNYWPLLCAGFRANIRHINKIHVVNDGLWLKDEADSIQEVAYGLPILLHEHEKNGFGASASINQGARSVESEYFCHTDSDIILLPKSLEVNTQMCAPGIWLHGSLLDGPSDVGDAVYPDLPVLREEWRNMSGEIDLTIPNSFAYFRHAYWLINTEEYLDLGGNNENMRSYGLNDYDFGMRWVMRHGIHSVELGPGRAYNLGGVDTEEDKLKKVPDATNLAIYNATLSKYIKFLREP